MQTKIESTGAGYRVITYSEPGANGWGVGIDFPTEEAAHMVASVIEHAASGYLTRLASEVRAALEDESNDADHDALVFLADALAIRYEVEA